MSATGELRRMLDERGVEHFDGTETTLWGYEPTGESTGAYRFAADETSGGRMQVRMFNITPEQAIAATLGGEEQTCHFSLVVDQDPSRKHRGNIHECSVCGTRYAWGFIVDERLNHCPNCGARVLRGDA